jgi:copper oxidase (laccase) domain-containing protein
MAVPAGDPQNQKKIVSLASVIGSEVFGARSQIVLSSLESPSPTAIEGFADDLLVQLLTFSDARQAEPFFSPNLVHGAEIQILDLTATRTVHSASAGEPYGFNATPENADGLIVIAHPQKSLDAGSSGQIGRLAQHRVRVGMRTADCLTWVCCLQVGQKTVVALAHLGWRGFTAALLWRMAKAILKLCEQDGKAWGSAWHYLSPSVFAKDYPCDDRDVGDAIRNLDLLLERERETESGIHGGLLGDALRRRNDEGYWLVRHRLSGFSGTKCYPDLQLLVLADLLCLGANPEQVIVHRVNTATSENYPSYRHRAAKSFQDGRSRLATVCSFDILDPSETIK